MANINIGGKSIPLVIPKTDKTLATVQPGQRYASTQVVPFVSADLTGTLTETKIYAGNTIVDAQAGHSVGISGNFAVAGAPYRSFVGTQEGSVYVFEKQNGTWTEIQELSAVDKLSYDRFGYSVAIDGDTILVGVYQDDPGIGGSGSVRVFENQAGTWTETQTLQASVPESNAGFGYSVKLEGNTAIIGEYKRDGSAGAQCGAAYIFEKQAGTWTETQKLEASDQASQDLFGTTVDINNDKVVISAPDHTDSGVSKTGAVYVFEKQNGTWTETQKIVELHNPEDRLGRGVAIHGDFIVAGAPYGDINGLNGGNAFVFEKQNGTWTKTQTLVASTLNALDRFGWTVDIEGNNIVVGAYLDDPSGYSAGGTVTVFENQEGTWTEIQSLTSNDVQSSDNFGYAFELSGDAIIVGSRGDDIGVTSNAGSAYIYEV